jgi:hypothetical protein
LGTSHLATQRHIPEEINPCYFTCSFVFPGCDKVDMKKDFDDFKGIPKFGYLIF